MNIAMFTNNYKPFVGGVPISIERLADGLRALGHTVYIFAPSYDGVETNDDKFTIRLKTISKLSKNSNFLIPNIFDLKIDKIFKSLNIDLIHVHHPFLLGSVGIRLGKKYNIPLTITYHTRYEMYLHNLPLFKKLYSHKNNYFSYKTIEKTENILVPKFMKNIFNKCDLVIAPTNSIKNHLENIDITSKVAVVPTGLSLSSFKFDLDSIRDINLKYRKNKKYLFSTVCRLSKEKNIEFLLKGIYILKEKLQGDFRLLIIGEGPLKSNLIKKIKKLNLEDNITLLGNIDNSNLKDYYKASDLFLFSSKSETQGIVLLEAMAGSTPVVAIESSGINDIVKNNINGFKTKDSVKEWTNKVTLLLKDKNLYRTASLGAFKTASKYKNNNTSTLMLNSYLDCIYKKSKENTYETKYKN